MAGEEILGLIQLNDHCSDMFTEKIVSWLEDPGEKTGLAVKNSMVYEEIKPFQSN
ncbi:hypothetical protein ACFL5V_10010 [Fibrobacterota bacterium]